MCATESSCGSPSRDFSLGDMFDRASPTVAGKIAAETKGNRKVEVRMAMGKRIIGRLIDSKILRYVSLGAADGEDASYLLQASWVVYAKNSSGGTK